MTGKTIKQQEYSRIKKQRPILVRNAQHKYKKNKRRTEQPAILSTADTHYI